MTAETPTSLTERHTLAVEGTLKSTDEARASSLLAQEEMNRHAHINHWVTLSGILLAATLSLISVLMSWFGLHSTPKQAAAAVLYQQRMELLMQHQTEATIAQTAALDRLSTALIEAQKKAAIAEKEAVNAALMPRNSETAGK